MWRSLLYTVSDVIEDVYRYVCSSVSLNTVIIALQLRNPASASGFTLLKCSAFDNIKGTLKFWGRGIAVGCIRCSLTGHRNWASIVNYKYV